MLCSHCKTPIKDDAIVCPNCGQKISPPSKKWTTWLKLLAAIIVFCAIIFGWNSFTEHDELGETIQGQLKALKENHITEAYYEYGSHDFEKNVSLNTFRDYITQYPILIHNTGIHFSDRKIENNLAEVKATLSGADNIQVPIEYTLIKDNDKWKILNIQLPALATETPLSEAVISLLKDTVAEKKTVEEQLKALKDNDLSKAYSYATKEFREITSLDAFNEFLKRYPILSHYDTFEIKELQEGVLEVHLKNNTGTATFDYFMGIEDDQWKINGLRAQPKRTIES